MGISDSKSIENTPVWLAQAPNWGRAYPKIRGNLQNTGLDLEVF